MQTRSRDRHARSVASTSCWARAVPPTQSQLQYQGNYTKSISVLGSTVSYPEVFSIDVAMGRFFTAGEVSHRRRVVVLGQSPNEALFPNIDPIGKIVRLGNQPYQVIGVLGTRPSPGGLGVRTGRLRGHPAHVVSETVRDPRGARHARTDRQRHDRGRAENRRRP